VDLEGYGGKRVGRLKTQIGSVECCRRKTISVEKYRKMKDNVVRLSVEWSRFRTEECDGRKNIMKGMASVYGLVGRALMIMMTI